MDRRQDAATALTRRAPSHLYARAYRALLEARRLLQDPDRYFAAIPYEERQGLWDVSCLAYDRAMSVSTALAALPEFSRERSDEICAACWKLDPRTRTRGNAARVDAILVELHRLFEDAAREEASAAAIVPVGPER